MKERPILFNSEMVKAILDGKKTQTRQVIKPQPDSNIDGFMNCGTSGWNPYRTKKNGEVEYLNEYQHCPLGKLGDRLWVWEKHCLPHQGGCAFGQDGYYYDVLYAADEGLQRFPLGGNWTQRNSNFKWRSSIHMPRWASRILLEITDIRVEQVQEISHEDMTAEGVDTSGPVVAEVLMLCTGTSNIEDAHKVMHRDRWIDLWNSINAKPRPTRCVNGKPTIYFSAPWDDRDRDPRTEINGLPHVCCPNPWVWVISFKRVI